MDILIACHCKDTHKSILIIDLETLQPYSINESIGAVTEIATPEMLLQKFNIGSISYIDINDCEDKPPDQFTNWGNIATGSIDKIITIYCSGYVKENVNRILKPDGKITFWGTPENIDNFKPSPVIKGVDKFLFVPYDEWRRIRCNKILLPDSDPDYDPEDDDAYRNKVIVKLTNLIKTLEHDTASLAKASSAHKTPERNTSSLTKSRRANKTRKRKTKSKRKKKSSK